MRGVVLVDTGPLFALWDASDAYHLRARTEGQSLDASRLSMAVIYPTLLESHRLMLRKLGTSASRDFLEYLERTAIFLNPEPDDFHQAIETLRRFDDQEITLADALLAEVSLRLGVPVWTFDRHFDVMRVPVWRG